MSGRYSETLVAALAAAALTAAPAAAQPTPVLVVVDSLEADPASSEVTLVVRTTVAAAVGSGSLVLEAVEKGGGSALAFSSVVSAVGFSTAGDVVASANLDVPSQRIDVTFSSASGTMNEAFGPLVALTLGLQPGHPEDTRFDLRVVPGLVELVDPIGDRLDVLADRGRLRLRAPDPAAADIGPLGGEVEPGGVVVFGAATGSPFAIGSGTVEILFDPAFVEGTPDFVIDPRYGTATIDSIDLSTPGRVLASFTSTPGDLNATIYGLVFAVSVPTPAGAAPGAMASLSLGPATALFAPNGDPLLYEGGDADVLEVLPPELVARGAFEDGDLLEFTGTN